MTNHSLSSCLIFLGNGKSLLKPGAALLQEIFHVASSLGTHQLEHVIDTPVQQPQWQAHPELRASFLEQHGFRLLRETVRFEFESETRKPEHQPSTDHDVIFRSMDEVGEKAFTDAVRRVSVETLDQRMRDQREKLGPVGEARENVEHLKSLEYDPMWWELAYTPNEDLIGVTVPTEIPAGAAIGYIGVVPEMRGRGYVNALLSRGTATLIETGAKRIVADTDVHNTPMTDAFRRAGYDQFARRREYRASTGE